ncbi:MAG TPA: FHA domain-containing protein [Tepidiformaceae bacterium]|jgi:hypothetical protein
MTDSTELLALRLGLLAIIFFFVLAVALTMRSGLVVRTARTFRPARSANGPRLVIENPARSGLESGSEFILAGTMTIGRDLENGIVIADPSVSGRHATIGGTPAGWRLRDLGSTNGTFLDGTMVDDEGVLVRHGETVAFGSVVLRFYS